MGRCHTWLIIGAFLSQQAYAMPADFGLSPDNSQGLLLGAINSAHSSLVINIYQFEQPQVLEAIVKKIRAGLSIQILIEGQPFGKVSEEGKGVLATLEKEMRATPHRDNHLFVMTNHPQDPRAARRRYHFDHAKYVLIDQEQALVSSENFSEHGHPTAGAVGNRGWEVLLHDSRVTAQLQDIFSQDTDLTFGDVVDAAHDASVLGQLEVQTSQRGSQPQRARSNPAIPPGSGEVNSVRIITSPDSASGLTDIMQTASNALSIEEMNLPLKWRSDQSKLITGLIDAARRRVHVRVLLNDDSSFANGPGPDPQALPSLTFLFSTGHANQTAVDFLQQIATTEHLPLEARIINNKAVGLTYVHNKGMIADGQRVLVSSINGTENSVMNNREVGVLLESPAAASYFGQAFDYDWELSAR